LTESDYQALHELPEARELHPGAYVCIHAGARASDRRWPPERFAAVADVLAASGLQAVLTGTAAEAPLTRAVAAAMRTQPIDLTGKTSLGTLGAVLKNARLLLSNDTGISHVAAALQVPSVIIAGFDTSRWAPLNHNRHRVVYDPSLPEAARILSMAANERCLREACVQFNQHRRKFRTLHITVDDVLNEVNDLLQRSPLPAVKAVSAAYSEEPR
jgi:ADP-heptose:LPS heptosyltransferase